MDSGSESQSEKRKCNLKKNHPRNGMNSLPHDIALNILSRLPITSLIQFRYVCRAWHMLSHDQHLINLQLARTVKNNPFLIFHCRYPIRNQLYFVEFSDRDDKEKVRKIQTPFCTLMPEFNVVGSCNGILCLSDSLFNDPIYIYNPFTRKYKELPETRQFQDQDQEVGFGFGLHPMTNEYKVVKIVYHRNVYNGPRQSEVQVFSFSSNMWRSIGRVPYQLQLRSQEASLVNGRLHWVTRYGRNNGAFGRIIISFDLADERFREVPMPDSGGIHRCNYHLAVLGGCLAAAVCRNYGKLEIWVMKEYNVKESWTKEFDIRNYTPKTLNQDLHQPLRIYSNGLKGRIVQVLCLSKNGEILLDYKGGSLASYDPESGRFKDLVFQGMPSLFQTVVHEGSLNWVDMPVGM